MRNKAMNLFRFSLPVLFIASMSLAWAQDANHVPSDHRGDPKYRRKTEIDGNQIRASIFN